MIGLRNRLVTEQNGRQHVSSVLIADEEIMDMLDWECRVHEATGWDVQRYGQMIRARRGSIVRWIWVRTRLPLEDTL